MEKPDESAEQMQAAWEAWCDTLRDAPRLLFEHGLAQQPPDSSGPDPSDDRRGLALDPRRLAEGYRYLARLTAMALERGFEGGDADHPRLLFSQGPARKIGGDCPDAIYRDCAIDGRGRYRLHGRRGNAASISLSVNRNPIAAAQGKPAVVASLTTDEIDFESDGRFEILLGGEPRKRNWCPLASDASRLIVRQFFGDREDPEPARLLIERLDAPSGIPAPLGAQDVTSALGLARAFLGYIPGFWADEYARVASRPNLLTALSPEHQERVQALPGGIPFWGHYRLAADEALLIEVTPPDCAYWSLLCGTPWFESPDNRHHPASLDMDQAELDTEGRLHAIVCARDPGFPNWLDTAGYAEGFLLLRWLETESAPEPRCRVLPLDELASALPTETRRVTAEERARERAHRRRILDLRFQGL